MRNLVPTWDPAEAEIVDAEATVAVVTVDLGAAEIAAVDRVGIGEDATADLAVTNPVVN